MSKTASVAVVARAVSAAVVPIELASHGPVYTRTNFIPQKVVFLYTDYNLVAGKNYQFETTERVEVSPWTPVVDPYRPAADEVLTRSINVADFARQGYMRMRVIP